MRANRAYELIVSRDDPRPAPLIDPESIERIEIVSIDDGETVLYWEVPAREGQRLLRDLRRDLAGLDHTEFLRTWEGADVGG
jgi:hypothetical protein